MKWTALIAALVLAITHVCPAAPDLWDDSRYMHVADVKAGMTGYGLTVFTGSRIDKFDVQVVDVLKNLINPKCDVILITCRNAYLEHVGPVEGMSGSPIYLYDLNDARHSHPRMVGAFAYGWEWSKDPLAGVQPIEYMLKIPGQAAASAEAPPQPAGQISRPRWSLADAPALPGFNRNGAGYLVHTPQTIGPVGGIRPLSTPLMISGLSPAAARRISPLFAQSGLDLLEGGASGSVAGGGDIRMEPGAVLVAPLLIGDMDMTASGTCTEVRGNRVFAFGHEFNNEGPIRLPMGNGTVATVVADLHSSFKLASLGKVCGTLTSDQTVGVSGVLGEPAPMVPIHLHVHYADGSLDQTYQFQAALHSKFTPLVAAAAVQGAIAGVKDLPQYHTLDYNLKLDFADNRSVRLINKDVNDAAADLAQQIALPIMAAGDNPFQKVALKEINGTIEVSNQVRLAEITSITIPKLKFAPGVQVKAFVVYRPWHAGEQTMPITFDLPRDLPDGDYQLVVSDWERFFNDQRQSEPFRFSAESIDELFGVVTDFEAVRHDAVYVRLVRQPDGVAVGRQALPRLPSSVRDALLAGQRSNLTAFVSSTVQIIPTDSVMSGSAEFALTIDRQAHVESGKAKPTTQP